jgi:tetratricopeptide (TPR) repeat protein
MFYEAEGSFLKAQEIYLDIIDGHPEDQATLKRLISFYRNNDMVNDAIKMMNKYLEINQVDEEAWAELADIYLSR